MTALAASAVIVACAQPQEHGPVNVGDVGQWIWSKADSGIYANAVRSRPGILPTVWVGSIHGAPSGVTSQLALNPRIAAAPRVGIVIRFEDSFTQSWAIGDSALAENVAAAVGRLVSVADAAGIPIAEVQLDYDCPERLLGRWSALVARLVNGPLTGRTVWLTSLVSHLRVKAYGDLFRPHVAGHIVQVFDTGDRTTSSFARELESLATRQRMPFRLGVAAFERELANGQSTEHRAWFDAVPSVARSSWYRGLWVFPGGRPWVPLLE